MYIYTFMYSYISICVYIYTLRLLLPALRVARRGFRGSALVPQRLCRGH